MREKSYNSELLLRKYFEENSLIASDIESFNNFIDKELQRIVDENKDIEPTIIPPNVEEFKIRLDKIWVTKPEITEADGSKRNILPSEARLRKLTYSSPMFLEISSHINGVQRESLVSQIGNLPIQLRSKYCHLHDLTREELMKAGEDPDDPGGYFIINGSEKIIVNMEDLASNRLLVERNNATGGEYIGKVFSEAGSYKIPHVLEKSKDGVITLTFTRVKKIPIVVILKALGMTKDQEIAELIGQGRDFEEMVVNLFEFVGIKTQEDALDYIAKKINVTQPREQRIERMYEMLDRFLLPHIGMQPKDRIVKAYNLCKITRRYLLSVRGELSLDDKDHYLNKRCKMSGDLLADLIRVNLRVLIGDLLYNFQRIVKRGKFPSIKVIIRDKLLTQRIYSSLATGIWVGTRKGVSQRIQRHNFLDTVSHLQRVVSPLDASQENFEARALHPTHFGRLCAIETPEGPNIGLRKNLAMLCNISQEYPEEPVLKALRNMGMRTV